MSNSLQAHEPQHARPPCPSPTPEVHPNPCSLSQWCHTTISPLWLPSPPALQLSQHQGLRVFSNESALHIRWPKYWSFSFNISPTNEHPGLISFGMDWLDLPAVQGTLKSLLQYHSSKASILWHSVFFNWEIFPKMQSLYYIMGIYLVLVCSTRAYISTLCWILAVCGQG